MIRTLQDHAIHQGSRVYMEHTITALLKDGDRVAGRVRLRPRARLPHASSARRRSSWRPAASGARTRSRATAGSTPGDGHALAYDAGADLMDLEFVQFHPTGMVWPPSVRGILVTEGVRGEGGVLLNKDGRRFLFDDIPDNYQAQTADSEEEGWRYTQGDKSARRPPELLTRDHVARCIMREVRAGRGSPHGGVYLDIAWIGKRLPNAAEHIKKKLPSMYHQFKQLAGIDITKEPMEVGPTTHYIMGGIKVDGDTQMSTVPGLFAAGECAAGLHGANRLGGNSLSDLLVFGKRAGEHAAAFAKSHAAPRIDERKVEAAASRAARAVPAGRRRRGSVPDPAGAAGPHAREGGDRPARGRDAGSARRDRAARQARGARRRRRKPRVQPRLAHGHRPRLDADLRRGDHALGVDAQGEPRRPLPRRLSGEGRGVRLVQHPVPQGERRPIVGSSASRYRRCARI